MSEEQRAVLLSMFRLLSRAGQIEVVERLREMVERDHAEMRAQAAQEPEPSVDMDVWGECLNGLEF